MKFFSLWFGAPEIGHCLIRCKEPNEAIHTVVWFLLWSGFHLSIVTPKPKQLLWPIRTDVPESEPIRIGSKYSSSVQSAGKGV